MQWFQTFSLNLLSLQIHDMASPASKSSVTFNGQKIESCFLDVTDGNIVDETSAQPVSRTQAQRSTDPSAAPLPVSLRFVLDQRKHNGFFRLYTIVELLVDRQTSRAGWLSEALK